MELLSIILVIASLLPFSASDRQGDGLYHMKVKLNAADIHLMQANPSSWNTVILDNSSNVVQVTLASLEYKGVPSPRIPELEYLSVLSLPGNNITGGIPEQFGNLSRLTNLDLLDNLLVGPIPPSLDRLSELQIVIRSQKNLNGYVPDTVAGISSFTEIQMAYNKLPGQIPPQLFQVAGSNFCSQMAYNKLPGQIPPQLFQVARDNVPGNNLACGGNFLHRCASNMSYQGIVLGTVGGLMGAMFIICYKRRKNHLRDEFVDESGETFEGSTETSLLMTDDDDASSTTTETMFFTPRNAKSERMIKSWTRGAFLGRGSFGMVYEGISDEGVFFAVKEVSLLDQGSDAQKSVVALEQEIALLSQFEHENIVQYYGTDKVGSNLYIFIELVTQGSLSSLYRKYELQDSQVAAYTRQILSGLVYLHERNVVHRDIKCDNILVHANGSVKLADFGLAKEMSKINMLQSCKGTVYWMAPEVINRKKMYGPSADIWSLGCTVLEMLTRQRPFPDVDDWVNAFFMIGRGEQPPIPNSLSNEAQDFIGQCVRVDPESRPSASQLLEHPFVNRPLRASFESSSPPAI